MSEGVFFYLQGETLGEGCMHSGLQRGFSALWWFTCSARADLAQPWLRCEGKRRKLGLAVWARVKLLPSHLCFAVFFNLWYVSYLWVWEFNLVGCESESHSVVSDSLRPHGLYSPQNSPGQNNGVGSCSLLRWSSQPRDRTQVSHIADGFFTIWATREVGCDQLLKKQLWDFPGSPVV